MEDRRFNVGESSLQFLGSPGFTVLTFLDHSTICALTELVGSIIDDPRLDVMVSPAYYQHAVCYKTFRPTILCRHPCKITEQVNSQRLDTLTTVRNYKLFSFIPSPFHHSIPAFRLLLTAYCFVFRMPHTASSFACRILLRRSHSSLYGYFTQPLNTCV